MGYALLFITIVAVVVQNCLAADVDCKKRPARVNPETCCPVPNIISEEIKEKCKEFMMPPSPISGDNSVDAPSPPPSAGQHNYGSHHRRPHGPPMHSCFMSCVLNETGIMTGKDVKLNEEKLAAYLKIVLKDSPILIPVLEASFKTCSAKAEVFHAKMQEKMKNRPTRPIAQSSAQDRMMTRPRCPPFAAHLMFCVRMDTLMNCPTTIWSDTKECNDMRDHMKQCMPKMDHHSMEDSNSSGTEEVM